ncbi:MAG: hypothetical protein CMP43_02040 [Rickettsiales bacterium]|nr:hypothetical protein [Rickettsiales bacterium]|tara:strand:+ start:588 stop:767 length:180 start_codon:yes stop_codon:yes gene_type:complete
MYTLESERNRRIILTSDDKEGLIKVCRELNELDQNATMVETFAVTKSGETIYGGQVKAL